MNITVFGAGYVGLVSAACFAEAGYQVMCIDTDEWKLAQLQQGRVPLHEPGLEQLVRGNLEAGRLHFDTSAHTGVAFGEAIFIAVGTPPEEDGGADVHHVLAVANDIGRHMDGYRLVIVKSTAPVGTAVQVGDAIRTMLDERHAALAFDVVVNPEFLKEGAAVQDFMKPDRIVIGTAAEEAAARMRELYAPFNRNRDRMIVMDERSAELTKYAANAMLAARISFMNELSHLAERLGADIESVRIGIGADPRIGYQFIYAGCGYGGACFPKDVRALAQTARRVDYEARLLNAVHQINEEQKHHLFELIVHHYGSVNALRGRRFALWGLAFKPNTEDMREAPSRVLMEELWRAGAIVQAYDPEAMEETQRLYGYREDLLLTGTKEAALQNAGALVICTEWKGFMAPDFAQMAALLKEKLIFDGRNIYDPARLSADGWLYYGMGRGASQRLARTAGRESAMPGN